MLNCWVVIVCDFSREYLPHQGLSYQESCSLLYLFINSYIRIFSIPAAVESDFLARLEDDRSVWWSQLLLLCS